MTPFELARPTSLAEAVSLLDSDNPQVRPFAGGTALMLMMKTGMYRPTRLVWLKGIEDRYASLSVEADGALRIGAMMSLRRLELSPELQQHFPVLADALHVLSNVRVRNVATVGGAMAHGDPHMDLPPVMIALGATVHAVGPKGERQIGLEDFFVGYYETVLKGDELISDVRVPAPGARRAAYLKCTTRSAEDWPALGVAVSIDMRDGKIAGSRVVLSAATETPSRMVRAEAALSGSSGDAAFPDAAAAAASEAEVMTDQRGSAPYKRQLVRVYVERALRKAMGEGPPQ